MKYLFLFFIFCSVVYNLLDYEYVDNTTDKEVTYEIKGSVNNPGVYNCNDCNINEAINNAGGLKENADTNNINLNKKVMNNDVIVINTIPINKCISINSASIEELMTLNGIGEKTAIKIIEYRNIHNFQAIEDIMNIKGIKEGVFNKIKDNICL